MGRNRRAQKGEAGGGGGQVVKVGKAGPTTMVSRAKKWYKEDVKNGDAEGEDAERVRRELGETCHNDKPGRNDGDGGE